MPSARQRSYLPTRSHRFYLSNTRISDDESAAWISWLREVCQGLGLTAEIFLERTVDQRGDAGSASGIPGENNGLSLSHDWAQEDLVTVSGSAVLTRALLERFHTFQIRCRAAPNRVNVGLLDVVQSSLDGRTANQPQSSAKKRLVGWRPCCTLMTSMFNGDDYVEGFLENSAALEGYESLEHIIVQPASPGSERAHVVEHIDAHSNTVSIWLHKDPGLYDVWNMCCRLASAPYLSNANIDDRRAPSHVLRLAAILDNNPDVDVASSALRVTTRKNLRWEQSGNCDVWYNNEPEEKYTVQGLLKWQDGEPVAHNLPHCMPLWRRHLHVWNGYFDEQRFGPSADWEFWLRAGVAGARFFILGEPLGLYLRSKSSYWQRATSAKAFDRRIAKRYAPQDEMVRDSPADDFHSRNVDEMLRSRQRGDWLRYLWILFKLQAGAASDAKESPALARLLEKLTESDLQIQAQVVQQFSRMHAEHVTTLPAPIDELVSQMINVLHAPAVTAGKRRPALTMLAEAFAQLDLMIAGVDAPLAQACIAHLRGDRPGERRFLSRAFERNQRIFWPQLQATYRFTRPLDEIGADIGGLAPFTVMEDIHVGQTVYCFPDYAGNLYQDLFYTGLEQRGVRRVGINDIGALCLGEFDIVKGDVLHIHWINSLYKTVSPKHYGMVMNQFLEQLDQLKSRGMRIYWTVHNRYSHDLDTEEHFALEREFRTSLCLRADQILFHHPCLVAKSEDWLPANSPISFVEHGNYIGSFENRISRSSARDELDLEEEDQVLCIFGQLRPYKGLAGLLPHIHAAMAVNDRLKLIVAGRISCDLAKKKLRSLPKERVIVHDQFVDSDMFQTYFNASDYALLCYRDILTSGSLFHALSFGLPVIAPALGSIPCYVVNGWNGFLYESGEQLEALLSTLPGVSEQRRKEMARCAGATASSLKWPDPKRHKPPA